MRESQPEQRERDRHHLGRGAAGAQVVKRGAEQIEEDGKEHFRGPGDCRPQQRRMQGQKKHRRHRSQQRQPDAAKGNEPDSCQQGDEAGRQQDRRRRSGRSDVFQQRSGEEWNRRIGGDDPSDRHFALAGRDRSRPQGHGVVGNETRFDGESRQRKHGDEGEQRNQCCGNDTDHSTASCTLVSSACLETPCCVFSQ